MTTADFASRIVGLFVFTFVGARVGFEYADSLTLPADATSVIFGLVGSLTGLILTPWLTVRPLRFADRTIREMSVDVFFMTIFGAGIGLSLAKDIANALGAMLYVKQTKPKTIFAFRIPQGGSYAYHMDR